jgi:uncharacterized repeat protein (TIGR02543 family)
VTLTATPAAGFTFMGWSGDASGTDNPLKVVMDGNKTITATFADVTPPQIEVTRPAANDVLFIGAAAKIAWTAMDPSGVPTVTLYLSRDGGVTYELMAADVPNTGTYTWTVTGPGTNTGPDPVFSAILQVFATDGAGNTGTGSSGSFAIYDLATDALLSLFQASPVGEAVELRWQFARPTLFTAVRVERSEATTGPWVALAAEPERQGDVAVVVDRTAEAGQTYFYRLQAQLAGGGTASFGPLSATAGVAIRDYQLQWVGPNPTAGPTRVDFAVPRESRVKVSVLDVQGREVAVLAEGVFQAGRYQATWSGRTERGLAPAGMYFVRYQTPVSHLVRRLVLAR